MSARSIPQHQGLGLLREILRSATPNFGVLFVLALLAFIWTKLSPLWWPVLSWAVSFFVPVFVFLILLCGLFVVVGGVFMALCAVAAFGMLLGGTIPGRH
ncbi:MAG: hypothetical protein ABSD39_03155 [Terriglobales bacterium]|jgi:hypothetical protein